MSKVGKKDPTKPAEQGNTSSQERWLALIDANRPVDPTFAASASRVEKGLRVEHLSASEKV